MKTYVFDLLDSRRNVFARRLRRFACKELLNSFARRLRRFACKELLITPSLGACDALLAKNSL